MTKLKTIILGLTGATILSAAGTTAALAEWKPRKPVEFVIMAGKGGGADQLARLMQGLIDKKDLSPRPFIPINKAGGSGAEALQYMKDKAGDDHTIMVTLNSFYTTPIIQKNLNIDISQFTPIGLMALDTFLLWVNSESSIDNLDSYVATVQSAGRDWKVGGTGTGQEDSILTAMMEAEFGYKVTYIPFSGGGTVAKNLIGNHVDSTVNNPSEQSEFFRAGQSRPIVQFTAERTEAFPDVPTAREAGADIEYYMQRSINGPAGMDPEAVAFYIGVFEELFKSEEWQAYCLSEGLYCSEWVAGKELADFHAVQYDRHEKLIAKVGAKAITGE